MKILPKRKVQSACSFFSPTKVYFQRWRIFNFGMIPLTLTLLLSLPQQLKKNIPILLHHQNQSFIHGLDTVKESFLLDFSQNSHHLILTCSLDHKIKLWNFIKTENAFEHTLDTTRQLGSQHFLPVDMNFFCASLDKSVKVWETESGQCLNRLCLDSMDFWLNLIHSMRNNFLSEQVKIAFICIQLTRLKTLSGMNPHTPMNLLFRIVFH